MREKGKIKQKGEKKPAQCQPWWKHERRRISPAFFCFRGSLNDVVPVPDFASTKRCRAQIRALRKRQGRKAGQFHVLESEKGRDSCNWLEKKREIERQERGRMGGTQQKN